MTDYARVRELDHAILAAEAAIKDAPASERPALREQVKALKREQQREVNRIWREEQKRPHPDQPSGGASEQVTLGDLGDVEFCRGHRNVSGICVASDRTIVVVSAFAQTSGQERGQEQDCRPC